MYTTRAMSWENLFMPYANNKGADQPVQSDQHFRCLLPRNIIPQVTISKMSRLYLNFQALPSFCGCAGRYVYPGRKPRRQVFLWRGSLYTRRKRIPCCSVLLVVIGSFPCVCIDDIPCPPQPPTLPKELMWDATQDIALILTSTFKLLQNIEFFNLLQNFKLVHCSHCCGAVKTHWLLLIISYSYISAG